MNRLTILQQNDTHGCLEIHPELFWSGDQPEIKQAGGFSRISKYVEKVKSENQNVLFFDGGDLFHGTLPLVASKGEAILPVLEALPLDGWVPGNWDFAYGKEQLRFLASRLHFPTLACNVKDEETGRSFLKPYMIKEMDGITVGVIGLTYPYVDETMPASFSDGLTFSRGIEEARASVEQLKGEVDLIVLVSHLGLPLDVRLASIVDGIDIVLSGHSHDRIEWPITVNGTLVVQAGSSSSFLGRIDVLIESGKIADYQYRLISIDESFPEDEEAASLVAGILQPYSRERETIVGTTDSILHRMTLNEAPMDKLITDAYLHATECDLAFSHGWRYGPPIPPGEISEYDLHSIIPANPEIFTLEMSGDQLVKALEENLEMVFSADPFKQKGGYVLRSSGLFMAFKPYNPVGNRIEKLLIGGKEVVLSKKYKVTGGGKQLFKGAEASKRYHGIKAIDVLKQYLAEKQTINIDRKQRILSI